MADQRADISNAATTAIIAKNTTDLRTDIDAGAAIPVTTGTGKITHNQTNTTVPNAIMETATATKFKTKYNAAAKSAAAVYTATSARWAPPHCKKKCIMGHKSGDVTPNGNKLE